MYYDKGNSGSFVPRPPERPDATWVMSARLPPGPYDMMELLGFQGRNFKAISALTNCSVRIINLGDDKKPIVAFYDYEKKDPRSESSADLKAALIMVLELAAIVHPETGKGTVLNFDRTINLKTCSRRDHPRNPLFQFEQETNTMISCNWEHNSIAIRPRSEALRKWMRRREEEEKAKTDMPKTDYDAQPDCEKASKLVTSFICEFIPMLVPINFYISANELRNNRGLADVGRKTNTHISVADVHPPIVLIHPMLGREKSDLEKARGMYLHRVKNLTEGRKYLY